MLGDNVRSNKIAKTTKLDASEADTGRTLIL
jgi:hypothetical protein